MLPPPSTDSSTTTATRLTTIRVVALALVTFGIGVAAAALILKVKPATQKTTRQATVPSEALTSDLVPGWPIPLPKQGVGPLALPVDITSSPGKELVLNESTFDRGMVAVRSLQLAAQPGWPTPTIELLGGTPIAYWKSPAEEQYFAAGGIDYLHVYRANGTIAPGNWPVRPAVGCCVPPNYIPIIDDITGDSAPEVFWYRTYFEDSQYQNGLWLYDIQGNVLPGVWPVIWSTPQTTQMRAVIGDIRTDLPGKEIVVVLPFERIRLFRADGVEITDGWPVALASDDFPTLVNIDSVGGLELLVCGSSGVTILRGDGTTLPGWPRPARCRDQPIAADIDADGHFEIIVTSDAAVYIWELDTPTQVLIPLSSPPNVGARVFDVDGQPGLEVVVPKYHALGAYRLDGTEIVNTVWPKPYGSFDVEEFIAGDLRNDGTLDLLVFTYNNAYLYDLSGRAMPNNQYWPIRYGTPGRTSVSAQCVDGTAFGQCANNPVLQRCVNGELRPDSTCAPQPRGRQQIAP